MAVTAFLAKTGFLTISGWRDAFAKYANVGRVKEHCDVPVIGATQLTGTLRFTRPTLYVQRVSTLFLFFQLPEFSG